jgi:hypothetical protein
MVKIEIGKVMNLKRITKNNQPTKFPFVVTSKAGFGAGTPQQEHFKNAGASQKCSPGRAQHFQELRICGHGTILALTFLGKGVFMDIEVKRMSPTAVEMLDQLSAVCKRFGVDYYAASQNQRDLLDSIALQEYQLKKAHEQGLKRSEVPPFLGLKRSDRSNDMPA